MSDIKAKITQSGLLKGSTTSQGNVIASKVEVNTAGINLGDLTNVTVTSPADGGYIIYDSNTNTFIDDQTIIKTNDGIDVTGTITFDGGTTSADLHFGDDDKALFGPGNELKIYHSANNQSYIHEVGSGDLNILATNLKLQDADENLKVLVNSTGVDVTGTITFDGGTTSADLNFQDDVKVSFGAGSDLQIFHQTSNNNSIIRELVVAVYPYKQTERALVFMILLTIKTLLRFL